MSDITIQSVQDELTRVNIAISDLISNKRIEEFKLSSAEFSRWYKNTGITLTDLTNYRSELRGALAALQPDVIPVIRANACIPLVVRKEIC